MDDHTRSEVETLRSAATILRLSAMRASTMNILLLANHYLVGADACDALALSKEKRWHQTPAA